MSKSNTRSFIIRLFVFVVSLALVGTDLVVSAQNTNSGTTMQNDNMSAQNSNMSGTNANRRGRRRGNANTGMANANTTGDMQGNVNTGEATSNANMTGKTSMGGRRRRGRRRAGNMVAATTASTTPQEVMSRRNESPIANRRRTSAGERTIRSIGKFAWQARRIRVAVSAPEPRWRMTTIRSTSESAVGRP